MTIWSRRLLVLLVVAFAAGTVAHAAQAAGAAAETVGIAGDMSTGCDGCGDDGGTPERACAELCVAPGLAVLPDAAGLGPAIVIDAVAHSGVATAGKSAPPDPDPPRRA